MFRAITLQGMAVSAYGAVDPRLQYFGSAQLSASASLAATGATQELLYIGTISFTGSSLLQCVATRVPSSNSPIAIAALASVSLLNAGLVSHYGSAIIQGRATNQSAGFVAKFGSAALSGNTLLTVARLVTRLSELLEIVIVPSTEAGSDPYSRYAGAAELSVSSVLSCEATGGITTTTGGANLAVSSTLAVSGFAVVRGSTSFSAKGTVGVAGKRYRGGRSSLVGQSSLAVGSLATVFGSASLTGTATLTASALEHDQYANADLSISSTLIASGTVLNDYFGQQYGTDISAFSGDIPRTELDPLLTKKSLYRAPPNASHYIPEPTFEEEEQQSENTPIPSVSRVLQVAQDVIVQAVQAQQQASEVRKELESRLRTISKEADTYLKSIGAIAKDGSFVLSTPQVESITQSLFADSLDPVTSLLPEVIRFEQEMRQLASNLITDLIPPLSRSTFVSNPSSGWYYNWMDREATRVDSGKNWLSRVLVSEAEGAIDALAMGLISKVRNNLYEDQELISGLKKARTFLNGARSLLYLAQLRKRTEWGTITNLAGDYFRKTFADYYSQSLVRLVTPLFMSVTDRLLDEILDLLESDDPLISQLMPYVLDPVTKEIEKLEIEVISIINNLGQNYEGLQAQRQQMVDLINNKQGSQYAIEMIDSCLEVIDQVINIRSFTEGTAEELINQMVISLRNKLRDKQQNKVIPGNPNEENELDRYIKEHPPLSFFEEGGVPPIPPYVLGDTTSPWQLNTNWKDIALDI